MKEAPGPDPSASSGQHRGGYVEKADYESRPGGNPGANGWYLESIFIEMPPLRGGICERLTCDFPSTLDFRVEAPGPDRSASSGQHRGGSRPATPLPACPHSSPAKSRTTTLQKCVVVTKRARI